MEYLFDKCELAEGGKGFLIPREFVNRWMRQMKTPYEELPENEKESDKIEADKLIELFTKELEEKKPSGCPNMSCGFCHPNQPILCSLSPSPIDKGSK